MSALDDTCKSAVVLRRKEYVYAVASEDMCGKTIDVEIVERIGKNGFSRRAPKFGSHKQLRRCLRVLQPCSHTGNNSLMLFTIPAPLGVIISISNTISNSFIRVVYGVWTWYDLDHSESNLTTFARSPPSRSRMPSTFGSVHPHDRSHASFLIRISFSCTLNHPSLTCCSTI